MTRPASFTQLAATVLLALALIFGCHRAPVISGVPQPLPTAAAEAEAQRAAGATWTNEAIRLHYNHLVSAIGPADVAWRRQGLSAEERARRASAIRHGARITCRAMMRDPAEVEALRRRDQAKYGNPDGPTFEQLVDEARAAGATGDAVYEGIITSAQRTNEAVNAAYGIRRAP